MKRTISIVMMVSFLVAAGLPASAPLLDGSAAYAETSEKQIQEELNKIKTMVADLEKQVASSKRMSAKGMDKTMKMLKDVSNDLEALFREAPYRGE